MNVPPYVHPWPNEATGVPRVPDVPERNPDRLSGGPRLGELFPPLRPSTASARPQVSGQHGPFAFNLEAAQLNGRVNQALHRPTLLAWMAVLFSGANLAVSIYVLCRIQTKGG